MRSDRGALNRLADETRATCWFCGRPFERKGQLRRTTEHLTPRSLGGDSVPDAENLVDAHGLCNEFAGDLTRAEKEILRGYLMQHGPPLARIARENAMFHVLAEVHISRAPLFVVARPERK
jgi:hypothetical protein